MKKMLTHKSLKLKPFFIVTETLASQFAKALQSAIAEKVKVPVLRSRHLRERSFTVTFSDAVLNKLNQLTAFKSAGVSCPNFCTDPADISNFKGKIVFARTSLRGTQGEGIVEFRKGEAVPDAPLYVEYIPKDKEYRVHVLEGKAIDVQEKRKKLDFDPDLRNVRIRNLDNGYVFCRGNIHFTNTLTNLAVAAVSAVGYAYGAVDVIYNKKLDQYFVLEVNSKPGLEGTTLEMYANAIIDQYGINRS